MASSASTHEIDLAAGHMARDSLPQGGARDSSPQGEERDSSPQGFEDDLLAQAAQAKRKRTETLLLSDLPTEHVFHPDLDHFRIEEHLDTFVNPDEEVTRRFEAIFNLTQVVASLLDGRIPVTYHSFLVSMTSLPAFEAPPLDLVDKDPPFARDTDSSRSPSVSPSLPLGPSRSVSTSLPVGASTAVKPSRPCAKLPSHDSVSLASRLLLVHCFNKLGFLKVILRVGAKRGLLLGCLHFLQFEAVAHRGKILELMAYLCADGEICLRLLTLQPDLVAELMRIMLPAGPIIQMWAAAVLMQLASHMACHTAFILPCTGVSAPPSTPEVLSKKKKKAKKKKRQSAGASSAEQNSKVSLAETSEDSRAGWSAASEKEKTSGKTDFPKMADLPLPKLGVGGTFVIGSFTGQILSLLLGPRFYGRDSAQLARVYADSSANLERPKPSPMERSKPSAAERSNFCPAEQPKPCAAERPILQAVLFEFVARDSLLLTMLNFLAMNTNHRLAYLFLFGSSLVVKQKNAPKVEIKEEEEVVEKKSEAEKLHSPKSHIVDCATKFGVWEWIVGLILRFRLDSAPESHTSLPSVRHYYGTDFEQSCALKVLRFQEFLPFSPVAVKASDCKYSAFETTKPREEIKPFPATRSMESSMHVVPDVLEMTLHPDFQHVLISSLNLLKWSLVLHTNLLARCCEDAPLLARLMEFTRFASSSKPGCRASMPLSFSASSPAHRLYPSSKGRPFERSHENHHLSDNGPVDLCALGVPTISSMLLCTTDAVLGLLRRQIFAVDVDSIPGYAVFAGLQEDPGVCCAPDCRRTNYDTRATSLALCSKCLLVSYCSSKCRTTDAARHRTDCKISPAKL